MIHSISMFLFGLNAGLSFGHAARARERGDSVWPYSASVGVWLALGILGAAGVL